MKARYNDCQKCWHVQQNFSTFLSFVSPSPPTILIYFQVWTQSLSIGVKFVLPNVLFSKLNNVSGGGGYSFRLRGDLLRRHLKETQSTIKAIFSCVPTTFGSNRSFASFGELFAYAGLCIDVEVEGYIGTPVQL